MLFYLLMGLHFLISVTIHGSRPIVSLFADSLGASVLTIGLLVAMYAFFPMLLAIKIGKWLDNLGERIFIVAGVGGIALSFLIPFLFPTIAGIFVSQMLIGISFIFIHISLQKTVGNLPLNRDKTIATYSFFGSSGALVGPLLSGIGYDYLGFRAAYLLAMIIVFAAFLIFAVIHKKMWPPKKPDSATTANKHEDSKSSLTLLRDKKLSSVLIVGGIILYSRELFVAYFPLYGNQIGLSASSIGFVISVTGLATMMIRLFQFSLVRMMGRRTLLVVAVVISGLSYMLIPFSTHMIILMIFSILLGAGLGLGQPLSLVYALNMSPDDRQGEVLGVRITINRTLQFAAPILFGGLGFVAGVSPIFGLSGGILLLTTYLTRTISSSK